MPYLIDGHNLIGQMPELSLRDQHDEARLVQRLISFATRKQARVVVVFDSGLPGGKSRMSTRDVEVVFAAQHTNADRILLERIRSTRDTGYWIVVSNDNEVLNAARLRGMRAVRAAEFARELAPPAPAKKLPYKHTDDTPMDVYVSPGEVEQWLKAFNERRVK